MIEVGVYYQHKSLKIRNTKLYCNWHSFIIIFTSYLYSTSHTIFTFTHSFITIPFLVFSPKILIYQIPWPHTLLKSTVQISSLDCARVYVSSIYFLSLHHFHFSFLTAVLCSATSTTLQFPLPYFQFLFLFYFLSLNLSPFFYSLPSPRFPQIKNQKILFQFS